MTLAEAKEGTRVEVVKMAAGSAIKQRLLDMGIMPGTKLKIERYAPLKDPIHIKVKGYSLALRVSEGAMIKVKPVPNGEK